MHRTTVFDRQLLVQLADHFETCIEQAFAQRLGQHPIRGVRVLTEVFEVLAVVEEVEESLVLPGTE